MRKEVAAYLSSPAGRKRIAAIAADYNRRHRITACQCLQMAKIDVGKWAEKFVPKIPS